MKHIHLSLIALIVAVSAGCMKVTETKTKNGEPIFDEKAASFITSVARWCYQDTNGDNIFGTHVFLNAGSGEYAVYNANTKAYDSAETMFWAVGGDVLTMNMPKNVSWQRQMRAINDGGQKTLLLTDVGTAEKATLTPCNL